MDAEESRCQGLLSMGMDLSLLYAHALYGKRYGWVAVGSTDRRADLYLPILDPMKTHGLETRSYTHKRASVQVPRDRFTCKELDF